MFGRTERKRKEGVVDHLGEGDGEGGRGPFLHDIGMIRKKNSSLLFGIEVQGKRNNRFYL